ncbi:alpha/beta hydrolase [Vaginella massiliensis]|uniref:alpha/beta hydrolase n=1 Tax=Vaginella massiliensis TaxID=1816680 RepID=UPI003750FEF4
MKIYNISGLGANGKAFDKLQLNAGFEMVNIPWLLPENQNETLTHYAERMAEKINPNEAFMLMGLSFGGILVQELNRFVNPVHNLLISTVKNREELPFFMRFSARTNAHRLMPMDFIASNQILSYTMMRRLYYTKKQDALDDIFEFRDKDYLKWSIHKIVNWKHSEAYSEKNVTHIHGNRDIVFPIQHIKDPIVIDGGTHIMVMQKPKQVSREINKVLEKY